MGKKKHLITCIKTIQNIFLKNKLDIYCKIVIFLFVISEFLHLKNILKVILKKPQTAIVSWFKD